MSRVRPMISCLDARLVRRRKRDRYYNVHFSRYLLLPPTTAKRSFYNTQIENDPPNMKYTCQSPLSLCRTVFLQLMPSSPAMRAHTHQLHWPPTCRSEAGLRRAACLPWKSVSAHTPLLAEHAARQLGAHNRILHALQQRNHRHRAKLTSIVHRLPRSAPRILAHA